MKSSEGQTSRMSSIVRFGGSAAITVALLYSVFHEQSPDDLLELLHGVHRLGLIAFLLCTSLGVVVRALRYRLLLQGVLGKDQVPGFGPLLVVTSVRNALVDFLPARLGELSFLYILTRYGVPLSAGGAVFGICIALDIAALALLFSFFLLGVVVGVPGLASSALVNSTMAPVLLVGLLILFCLLLFVLQRLHLLFRFTAQFLRKYVAGIGTIGRHSERAEILLNEISTELRALHERGILGRLIGLTLVLRAAKYGGLYLLLSSVVNHWGIAFGQISPLVTTVAFLAAEASASLPISGLMGFGAYEGAWSVVFSLSEVKIPSVTSVILLTHLITQVVAYVFAFVALAVFLRRELGSNVP